MAPHTLNPIARQTLQPTQTPSLHPPRSQELVPITDWEHFQRWCQKHGRQALPASDETLNLYLSAQEDAAKQDPVHGLGFVSLVSAVAGIAGSTITLLTVVSQTDNLRLGIMTAVLILVSCQIIALATGWISRRHVLGRTGSLIAALSLGTAGAVGAWLYTQGGMAPLETFLQI